MFGVLRPPSPPERSAPTPEGISPPPRSLAPMPPSDFSSREDLLAGTKDWTARQGYAIVIARSRPNRLWLKCDRGGSYENRRNLTQDQRKRKRGESRLLGCPFRMLATVKKDGTWRVETDNPEHNHGASDDLSMHPTLRRMNEEQLAKVHQMFDAGRSPAETVEELKATWPNINVLTRDIYNARKKYKTQKEEPEALGATTKPVPDPNGVFPGPDENGRWAWVPDGEEVTNKKSKRRRRTAPPPPPQPLPPANAPLASMTDETLDPQLQNTIPTSQLPQLDAGRVASPNVGPRSTSRSTERRNSTGDLVDGSSHPQDFNGAPNPQDLAPSRFRSQGEPTTQVSITPAILSPPPNGSDGGDSPAVLAARIERMEEEQRDQKNMLAQILGAVKGITPPG